MESNGARLDRRFAARPIGEFSMRHRKSYFNHRILLSILSLFFIWPRAAGALDLRT
jgi:hypothetical protein